jgi:hypothetical protein
MQINGVEAPELSARAGKDLAGISRTRADWQAVTGLAGAPAPHRGGRVTFFPFAGKVPENGADIPSP